MNELTQIRSLFDSILNCLENEQELDSFQNYLQSFQDQQISRNKKRDIIQCISDDFIENSIVYYSKPSKIFFYYYNNNYILSNEDNILHNISEYINQNKFDEKCLDISVKNAIKMKTMKYIKEKCSIYENIPDSETIQSIVDGLTPAIFSDRNYAKLFLIFLGDILLKKYNINERPIIFTRPCLRDFIQEINKFTNVYFSHIGYASFFKYKFNEEYHSNSVCYVLPCNNVNMNCLNYTSQFKVNMICVSIYFSNRFDIAEEFIKSICDKEELYKSIMYLKNLNKEDIYNEFSSLYLQKCENDESIGKIREKDIIFLWKKYNHDIDRIVNGFSNVNEFVIGLYKHCGQSYTPCTELLGYVNKYERQIQYFTEFWNQNFTHDEGEFYFEIEEILHLYKKYNPNTKFMINELFITNMIHLNYVQYEIINNKVIHNLRCVLWDKKKELIDFINSLPNKKKISSHSNFNVLYTKYLRNHKNKKELKISKKYFTKFMEQFTS